MADDVSLYLRNEESYYAFLRLFKEYSELSGALLNKDKSKEMAFGNFASILDEEVEWVAGVKVLGVVFLTSGEVAQETWTDLRKKAEKKLSVASKFSLTLAERSYIIKSIVCAAFYYVARIAHPPRRTSQRLATLSDSFVWNDKTELVARPLLRFPTELGGFSILCIRTMRSVLALRGFYDLVNNAEYPGRKLVDYFLRTSRNPLLRPLLPVPVAIRRLRKHVYEQACVDLINMNEDQFLRKWSTRFRKLRNALLTY